jgi:hypothetical protein
MMMDFPDTEKKLRSRISSYKSGLNKEKKRFGYINDGAGKRYLLFALFFILNDLKKSEQYFQWYAKEFDDDVGEPIQKLCWAISLYRMDRLDEARYRLADLMLTNLYMIPRLLGENIKKHDIWHSSSDAGYDFYDYIYDEILAAITADDKKWIKTEYDSAVFQRIRQRYIEIFGQLKSVKDMPLRKRLLNESYSLLDQLEVTENSGTSKK